MTVKFSVCYHVIKTVIKSKHGTQSDSSNGKQAKALKKLTSSRHLSITELPRQAVDNMIRSNAVVDAEERRKRALDAAGRFRSGLGNLSIEHNKYLEEAFSE